MINGAESKTTSVKEDFILHPLIHSFSSKDDSTTYWTGQKGRDCRV